MMPALRQEIIIVVSGFVAFLLLGILTGNTFALLSIGLTVYAIWNLYNLNRLTRWLGSPSKHIPETVGVWDEIYYQLFHLYRRQRTAKRKLASILTRFQESTQALPYATIVLNEDKEIKWFNNAAKKMFELDTGHDIGQRIDNLVRVPAFVKYVNDGKYKKPLEFVYNERHVRVTITIYGNGQYLLGGHDVTARYEVDTMRRNFIANASHELRTPLTVISGYVEAISKTVDDKTRLPVERIQEQTERMQALLEELIALSKLETSDEIEDAKEIDVAGLLSEVFNEAKAFDQQRHELQLEVQPARVTGVRKELRVALSNLMTNAVRYSDEGSTITLYSKEMPDYIAIGVEDHGIGIAYEHMHHLTERFYRVDPGRSREHGGTGLGLAIVKHILDRHDARLSIRSEPGVGSTFECQIPRILK